MTNLRLPLAVGLLLTGCAHAALPTPSKAAPASIDALLAAAPFNGRGHIAEWKNALQPYVGAAIDWQVVSWGGEITSAPAGYDTPDRRLGPVRDRVRYVSPSLHGDLEEVERTHSIVVACATRMDHEEGVQVFARQDRTQRAAGERGAVRLRGRIWGPLGEEGFATLWMIDCEEWAPTAQH